jgi:hypothetical protein
MRLRIAERLKEAQNVNAMLTTFNEVDMRCVVFDSGADRARSGVDKAPDGWEEHLMAECLLNHDKHFHLSPCNDLVLAGIQLSDSFGFLTNCDQHFPFPTIFIGPPQQHNGHPQEVQGRL